MNALWTQMTRQQFLNLNLPKLTLLITRAPRMYSTLRNPAGEDGSAEELEAVELVVDGEDATFFLARFVVLSSSSSSSSMPHGVAVDRTAQSVLNKIMLRKKNDVVFLSTSKERAVRGCTNSAEVDPKMSRYVSSAGTNVRGY